MRFDAELDNPEPGTISVMIYVGENPTCPAGGACIGALIKKAKEGAA